MTKPSRLEALAVLEQHWKIYRTAAGAQRCEGRDKMARTYDSKADALKEVIDVLKGARAPGLGASR